MVLPLLYSSAPDRDKLMPPKFRTMPSVLSSCCPVAFKAGAIGGGRLTTTGTGGGAIDFSSLLTDGSPTLLKSTDGMALGCGGGGGGAARTAGDGLIIGCGFKVVGGGTVALAPAEDEAAVLVLDPTGLNFGIPSLNNGPAILGAAGASAWLPPLVLGWVVTGRFFPSSITPPPTGTLAIHS